MQLEALCLWFMWKHFKDVSKLPEWEKLTEDVRTAIEEEYKLNQETKKSKGKNCNVQ